MTKRFDLVGRTSGRLTVLAERDRRVLCECLCGQQKLLLRGNFIAGYTLSCGCLQKERAAEANSTHGWSRTGLYVCWSAMKRRCYNPNHRAWEWYGGRGIQVCPEWRDNFVAFAMDMGATWFEGATLDRKDSNLDYCKDNCQWLTQSENSRKQHVSESY